MGHSFEAVRPHVENFSTQLGDFTRLEETRKNYKSPERWQEVAHTFFLYRQMLKRLVNISDADLQIMAAVNEAKGTKGASGLLAELGPEKRAQLIKTLNKALDPESPIYTAALEELRAMMQNGQDIFDEEKKPTDGDPRSDAAIWGFTQIGPEHVHTQMHFLVCHFMERFMTQVYREAGIPMAGKKDYFLTAITDVLILEHLKNDRFNDVFALWQKPKAEGGLGWISTGRLEGYQEYFPEESAPTTTA
jgi:hypothetical protein